jgi:hypothetical protein
MIYKLISVQHPPHASSDFSEALKEFDFPVDLLASVNTVVDSGKTFFASDKCPLKKVNTDLIISQIYTELSSLKGNKLHKAAFHCLEVVFDNIPRLLSDPEIADGIKLKINPQRIATLITKIHLAFSETPLTARTLTEQQVEMQDLLVEQFTSISSKLKLAACHVYPRASHWNVREEGLWKWCLVMAEETRHPLVRHLEKTVRDEKFQRVFSEKLKELFRIIAEFIMFIAFCDDISDNLADQELSDLFKKVPFLKSHEIPLEIAKIEQINGGIFKNFYLQSVRIWQDCIRKFTTLVGDDLFSTHQAEFSDLFKLIMESMTLSVDLNLNPHHYEKQLDKIDRVLAPNMMIESFRWMEHLLVQSVIKEFSFSKDFLTQLQSPNDESLMTELVRLSQISGSQANSMATFYREVLIEEDLSNPLIYRINIAYSKYLAAKSTEDTEATLISEFNNFLHDKGYQNHFFSDYDEPKDFLDFMLLKGHIVEVLVNDLKVICLTHKIEMNFGQFKNIHDMVTAYLSRIREKATKEVHQNALKSLERRLRHLVLANDFVKKIAFDCNALQDYTAEYLSNITLMRSCADKLSKSLQESAHNFVDSWEEFAQLYLIFKHKPSGMI